LLRVRRLVEVTRERVGTQPSGLPVHGLVVSLFDRDADRYFADVTGQRRRFVPGGSLREGSSRRTLSA
jgi:hypothetical protein